MLSLRWPHIDGLTCTVIIAIHVKIPSHIIDFYTSYDTKCKIKKEC